DRHVSRHGRPRYSGRPESRAQRPPHAATPSDTPMTPPGLLSLPRWRRFWLLFALWTILGLIDAGQFYVHLHYFRWTSLHLEEALASGLADWYIWAILAPFIFRLGCRFPLDSTH